MKKQYSSIEKGISWLVLMTVLGVISFLISFTVAIIVFLFFEIEISEDIGILIWFIIVIIGNIWFFMKWEKLSKKKKRSKQNEKRIPKI